MGVAVNDNPGSGRARNAEKKERTNDVMVDKRIEWIYVLFVPFHRPHDPSTDQREESTASTEEADLRSRV